MSKELIEIEHLESKIDSLTIKQLTVGFSFDERMLLHKNYSDTHQERPERAEIIYCNLIAKGLKEKLIRIPAIDIEDNILLDTHNPTHFENVKNLKYEEIKEITISKGNKINSKDLLKENEEIKLINVDKSKNREITNNSFRLCYDTYDNYFTPISASISTGSLLNCAKFLVEEKVNSAFAIIRPPGHHANQNECRGFCFYNNVAVTAKYLIKNHNMKIAIVDWDVHHGDGTQEIFYNNNNPLFISLHRHDNGNFYPNISGKIEEQGINDGIGFNINIPWNTKNLFNTKSGIGDDEYVLAFNKIILPILTEYKPDFIIVSSGFDACENDPLGEMSLTPLGYSFMTNSLMKICPKILIALEGGYNLNSLQRGSEAIIRTLLGETNPFKNLIIDKFLPNAYHDNKTMDFYKEISLNDLNEHFFTPADYIKDIINKVIDQNTLNWKNLENKSLKLKIDLLRKNDAEKILEFNNIMNNLILEKKEKIDQIYWKSIFEITEEDLFTLKNTKKNSINFNQKSKIDEIITTNEKCEFDNENLIEKKINTFIRFNIGKVPFDEILKEKYLLKYQRNMHKSLRTISRSFNFRLDGISSNKDLKDKRINWQFTNGLFDVNEKNLDILIQKFLKLNKLEKSDIIEELQKLKLKSHWLVLNNVDLFNVDLIINFKKIENMNNEEAKNQNESNKKTSRFKVIKSNKKKYDISLKLNGIKKYSIIRKENNQSNHAESHNFYCGLSSLILYLNDLL